MEKDLPRQLPLPYMIFAGRLESRGSVYGHDTDGYSHNNPSEETVYFHSCAEFAEDRNDRLRITTMETCGSNWMGQPFFCGK